MRTTARLTAPALVGALLLSGCGSPDTKDSTPQAAPTATTAAGSSSTAQGGATPNGSATNANGAAACPTEATQRIPKTRFAVNVGLAAGTFHQWVYKPYRNGSFAKGAQGRTTALIKAGAAGLFAAKQLKDARDNVKADPTLCKALIGPLTTVEGQMGDLAGKVRKGDLSPVAGVAAGVSGLTTLVEKQGIPVEEKSGL